MIADPLPRFTENGGTYAQARSWALNAIERFETAGVRVPQHGRLREYAKQFELAVRAIETGEAGRLNLEYLHRALLDVTELSLIADQFATATPVNGFRYAANRAMKGGKLLGDEKNQSSARDFQFELFIAPSSSAAATTFRSKTRTSLFVAASVTSALPRSGHARWTIFRTYSRTRTSKSTVPASLA